MKWKLIVDDVKVNFFPFIYWPDAYSSGWKEIIGKNLQNTLLEFRDSKFGYYIDKEEWRTIGEAVFEKIKNTSFGEELVQKNSEKVTELMYYCHEISKKKFELLSNKELKEINENYSQKMLDANKWGLFISILEYENNILSDNLEKYLKEQSEKLGRKINFAESFATLVTPLKDNLMQKELKEYHALLEHAKNKNHNDLDEKIRAHTKKYCWIRYNYEGPAFSEKDLREKIKADLESKKPIPKRKTKQEIMQEQEKIEKTLEITPEWKRIFFLAREFMYWKTMRRDTQSFAFFVFEGFQRELAKRTGISLKEARQLHYKEVNAILDGQKTADSNELLQRQKHSIYLLENGKTEILCGKNAAQKALEIIEEEFDDKIKELKGNCAMPGRVIGIAKIINSQKEFFKLKESEIIVSFATTPDMSAIIKKAAAIVTDQGGITCHAAIVSRELKIPCIVGTKTATKIICDGEKIEVDASNGIVRRLESK